MRIAICLSGQPRSIEFARKSIQTYFSDTEDCKYDFFCHSWDYNTWKLQDISFTGKEMVDKEWLTKQLELFQPKAYTIETEDDYNSAVGHCSVSYGSLFYSMMQANQLKREYEIANDFRYDCVVKIRFDSIFNVQNRPPFESQWNGRVDDRLVYFPHCWRMPLEYNRINASDCVFYGDSWAMDIACDVFRILPRERAPLDDYVALGPGTYLSEFLTRRNVVCTKAPHEFNEVFYRKEVLGLDSVDDYDKIFEMHRSFYMTKFW